MHATRNFNAGPMALHLKMRVHMLVKVVLFAECFAADSAFELFFFMHTFDVRSQMRFAFPRVIAQSLVTLEGLLDVVRKDVFLEIGFVGSEEITQLTIVFTGRSFFVILFHVSIECIL